MRWVLAASGLLLSFAFCACGSEPKEESPSSGSNESEEIRAEVFATCRAFAEAYCTGMAECCMGVHEQHDAEACQDAFESTVCRPGADAVVEGQATFDADAVDPCLAAYASAFETCQANWQEVLDLRAEIYRACRVIDGRTEVDDGCQSSITCKKPPGAATVACIDGVCQAIEVLSEGDTCPFPSGDISVCDVGLYCTSPGLEELGLCAPAAEIDDACDPDSATNVCGLGNYCERSSETCQPAANYGGPSCDQHGECVSFSCDQTARECAPAAVVPLRTCVGG